MVKSLLIVNARALSLSTPLCNLIKSILLYNSKFSVTKLFVGYGSCSDDFYLLLLKSV